MPRKRRSNANKEDPLIGAIRSAAAESELAKRGGKTGEECSFTDSGETATLETKSTLIKTPEEALKKANIDTSLWEIERQTVNSWEVAAFDKKAGGFVVQPLWQVKLSLKRKLAKRYQDGIDWICERLKKKPLIPRKCPRPLGDILIEPSIYDAQMGRYAWAAETGQDIDIEKSTSIYRHAVQDFIARVSGLKISRILMPIGHDLLEANSWDNTTERGTMQDIDTRFPRVFGMAYQAVEYGVIELASIAPVDLVYMPGNHDPATSYYLCFALRERFRDWENVNVDLSPKSRKYYQWGTNLIGMTHGDKEKPQALALNMPDEAHDLWAQTKWHEFHTGHTHTAKTLMYITTNQHGGTRVRTIPSLAGPNRWTFNSGYSTLRQCAEIYIWDKREAYVGHFSVNARET